MSVQGPALLRSWAPGPVPTCMLHLGAARVRRVARAFALHFALVLALVLALAFALALALPLPARAETHDAAAPPPPAEPLVRTAWWRDREGRATIDTVAQQPFQPLQGLQSIGHNPGASWLRVQLPPLPEAEGRWVLQLQPPLLQDVQIYLPQPGGGWQRWQLGNRRAFDARPLALLNSSVPLPASSLPRTVYVRVATANWALAVRVLPQEAAFTQDSQMHAVMGVYAGFCIALATLSLLSYLVTGDRLWAWSATVDLATLLQASTQLGFVSRYLLPAADGVVHHLQTLLNAVHIALVMLFYVALFRQFSSRRWAAWPFLAILPAFPVELALVAASRHADAQALINMTVLAAGLMGLGLAWLFDPPDRLLRWTLRSANLVLVLYLIYYMAPAFLPLGPLSVWHFFPSLPSNLITMLFVAIALLRAGQVRAALVREESQRRRLAEQQLAMERRQHEATSGLLGMLLHEIRTPLARIQAATRAIVRGRGPAAADAAAGRPGTRSDDALARATARIDDAVAAIAGVLERCIETDQLERGQLQVDPQPLDAAARLRSWLAAHAGRERLQLQAPPSCPATLDAGLWLAMVANLVDNALKYGAPASPILLQLQREQGLLVLSVQSAVGPVGRPDAARLFGKHYRAERAAQISGTGLGLYWVKLLSQRLGGDVACLPPGAAPGAAGGEAAAAEPPVVFRLALPG